MTYLKEIEARGVAIIEKIPDGAHVFTCGALAPVIKAIESEIKIENLVVIGTFFKEQALSIDLAEFGSKNYIRPAHFDFAYPVVDAILKAGNDKIGQVFLIGKSPTYDPHNFPNIPQENSKSQNILACQEGLLKCGLINNDNFSCVANDHVHIENGNGM